MEGSIQPLLSPFLSQNGLRAKEKTFLSDVGGPEVDFFIPGQWFCPYFWANRLYKSKTLSSANLVRRSKLFA